jgi:hypothetical protein
MSAFKSKPKRAAKTRLARSPFAEMAQRAMRKAQKAAARENARWGLPMIVEPKQ